MTDAKGSNFLFPQSNTRFKILQVLKAALAAGVNGTSDPSTIPSLFFLPPPSHNQLLNKRNKKSGMAQISTALPQTTSPISSTSISHSTPPTPQKSPQSQNRRRRHANSISRLVTHFPALRSRILSRFWMKKRKSIFWADEMTSYPDVSIEDSMLECAEFVREEK